MSAVKFKIIARRDRKLSRIALEDLEESNNSLFNKRQHEHMPLKLHKHRQVMNLLFNKQPYKRKNRLFMNECTRENSLSVTPQV